jgi:hypothetical protein
MRIWIAGVMLMAGMSAAQTPQLLWPHGAPMAQGTADDDQPTLTAYLPASSIFRWRRKGRMWRSGSMRAGWLGLC